MGSRVWVCTACRGSGIRGVAFERNLLHVVTGTVFLLFAGQNREPFKIREQIKLEALDSDEDEEQPPLAMASNSIFESFPSYQSCFTRGEYRGCDFFFCVCVQALISASMPMFAQNDDAEELVCSVSGVLKSCG